MGRLILFLAWASLAVVRMPLALGEGAVATEGALDDATMGEAVQFLDDKQKKGSMAAPVSETEVCQSYNSYCVKSQQFSSG